MPLPLEVVDEIHKSLSVAWGQRFMALYDGVPDEALRADWAQVLDGITPRQLQFALDNLPGGRPMDAREFRALCVRCPAEQDQLALPDMAPRPAPEMLRDKLAQLKVPRDNSEPERVRWARGFVARFGEPGRALRQQQREFLVAARKILERHEARGLEEAKRDAQAKTDAALASQEAGHGA